MLDVLDIKNPTTKRVALLLDYINIVPLTLPTTVTPSFQTAIDENGKYICFKSVKSQ